MANIKTIIEADSSKHDSTIKKSANEVYKYQKKVDSAKKSLSNIIGTVSKFAGALGLAVGATAKLVEGLKSVETFSDKLAQTQRITNTVINDFFVSANSGSLDGFLNGLNDTIQSAKEAYSALDRLSTFKDFSSTDLAANDAKISKADYYIKALKAGIISENEAGGSLKYWQDELKTYQDERKNILNQLLSEYDESIKAMENEIFSKFKNNPNFKNWMASYTGDAFKNEKASNDLDLLKAQKQKFIDRSVELNDNISKNGVGWAAKEGKAIAEQIKNEKQAWESEYGVLFEFLTNVVDKEQKISEKNKVASEMFKTQSQYWGSLASNVRDLKSTKNSTVSVSEDNIEPKTIKTDKVEIIPDVILDEEALNDYFGYIYDLQTPELNSPFLDEAIGNNLIKVQQDVDNYNSKLEYSRLQTEKLRSEYESLSSTLNSVGNIFNQLGNAIGGETGEVLNFFGALSNAISNIIPQIATLVVANEADAIGSGTASAAKLPYPYNLAAIASIVAEIIGVFASLPKFADGGIFNGNNSIGDFNLARVNKGEAILNGTQQKRLFNILNGTGLTGNNSVNGNVVFKISGSDLVGTINNYNTKKGKVR